ncbi:MAG: ABC transporter substrate-binding protein [Lachnospiraceae bacterium]|nr:ABC transporter substrate-binding protein [Lachnospiraceae bacterium]
MNLKKSIVAAAVLLCGTLLGSCSVFAAAESTGSAESVPAVIRTEEGVTFTDALGREVTVTSWDRVAAMPGSFADVWVLAGGKEQLKATVADAWESFSLDLSDDVVNIGSILEPDVEQLIAAEPDFVIASANTTSNVELEELLTEAGITTAYFDVNSFSDYLHMLEICTAITGREDLLQQNGYDVETQIEEAKAGIGEEAPTVLLLRAASGKVKVKNSQDTVAGEMLADLGAVNIADSNESLLEELSMEAIVEADPDLIFVTIQGNDQEKALQNVQEQLMDNPAWAELSAVRNNRFYVLEKELYHLKPNARWGEAYQKLVDLLYPKE